MSCSLYQGSGIGRACSIGLAKDGAAGILVADLSLSAATQVAVECKAAASAADFKVEALQIDVTDESSVQDATEHMLAAFGRIDYCVNCAGVSNPQPFPDKLNLTHYLSNIDRRRNPRRHRRGRY